MKKLLLIIPAVVLLAIGLYLGLFTRVPVATIGIRQVRWGGAGIEGRDFEPGLRLRVAGYHLWHFLPVRTHFLHFIELDPRRPRVVPRGERNIEDWQNSLEIRTKDNNIVSIDVTVPYRIRKNEGHLIVSNGLKAEYPTRVRSTVESVLRSELSNLTTEDLQSTDLRLERQKETLPILNDKLGKFFVQADAILIRRIQFPQSYEEKLQRKQLLRQQAFLDKALTDQNNMEKTVNLMRAEIEAEVLKERREWEKKRQEAESEYKVKIAQIRADAEVYARRTIAEGQAEHQIAIAEGRLAVEISTALRDELRNEALSSRGGRIKLALEAVENLSIPSVTLNSDDPAVPMLLDLGQMTNLLVGQEGATSDALGQAKKD